MGTNGVAHVIYRGSVIQLINCISLWKTTILEMNSTYIDRKNFLINISHYLLLRIESVASVPAKNYFEIQIKMINIICEIFI